MKPIGQTPGAVFVAAPAATLEHGSTGDTLPTPEEAESILNRATYGRIHQTDADPAVLEVLDALDDDAFIDEGDFDDDFIVKLDREEARVLVSVAGDEDIDEEFERHLNMYSDYSDFDEEEQSIDVEDLDDALPFSKGGPSRIYQVEEVRRELREADAHLLERILYTSDDDGEAAMEIVEINASEDVRAPNCQTACAFLAARSKNSVHRPKLIRESTGSKPVDPIRISRKTGMPLESSSSTEKEAQRLATVQEEAVNKGVPRPKEETAEEKRARKAAIKAEQRARRATKKSITA